MNDSRPQGAQQTSIFDVRGFTASAWELAALLRLLRINAIPGLDPEALLKNLPAEVARAKLEAATDALAAHGLAVAGRGPGNRPTLTVATHMLAVIGACVSSLFTINIATFAKNSTWECYLHEWRNVGVAHIIPADSETHFFFAFEKREGLIRAIEKLTSRGAPLVNFGLGTISGGILRECLALAPTSAAATIEQRLQPTDLSANLRHGFAMALTSAYCTDEFTIAVYDPRKEILQATALLLSSQSGGYLCANTYAQADTYILQGATPQAVSAWLTAHLP